MTFHFYYDFNLIQYEYIPYISFGILMTLLLILSLLIQGAISSGDSSPNIVSECKIVSNLGSCGARVKIMMSPFMQSRIMSRLYNTIHWSGLSTLKVASEEVPGMLIITVNIRTIGHDVL